jgi:hypothetical protein
MPVQNDRVSAFTNKKCPYCEIYLSLNDTVCYSCKKKVGKLNELTGMADHPINWKSYIIFVISVAVLAGYIKWAFFK